MVTLWVARAASLQVLFSLIARAITSLASQFTSTDFSHSVTLVGFGTCGKGNENKNA